MKIKMKFGYAVYILTGVVCAVSAASSILNILILTGAGNFVKGNVAVTAVSLVCSILLLAVCICLLANSSYVFNEKHLTVWYGVFRVRYSYDEIIAVAEDGMTKKLFMQYADKKAKDGYGIAAINISSAYNADFIKKLLEKNDRIKNGNDNTPTDDIGG